MADGTNGAQGTFERNTNLTLWQRIHAAMSELPMLEKDGRVDIGRSHYEYISHDAVTAAAKSVFVKYGIGVWPTITNRSDDGNRCELDVCVRFVNIDDPEQALEMNVIGYGVDNQDKGPGKAFSYAMKYAYLKLLMLNSADDIEQDTIEHSPTLKDQQQLDAARAQTSAFSESWAHAFKQSIATASTVDALNDLQKTNKAALMEAPEVTRAFFIDLIEEGKRQIQETAE